MGRERKRGKLEDFNRLVVEGCDNAFSLIESDPQLLRSGCCVSAEGAKLLQLIGRQCQETAKHFEKGDIGHLIVWYHMGTGKGPGPPAPFCKAPGDRYQIQTLTIEPIVRPRRSIKT